MTTRQKQGRNRLLLSWLVAVVIALAAAGGWYWHSNKMPTVPVQVVAEQTSSQEDKGSKLPPGRFLMFRTTEDMRSGGMGEETKVLSKGLPLPDPGIVRKQDRIDQAKDAINSWVDTVKHSGATLLAYGKEFELKDALNTSLSEMYLEYELNGEQVLISSDKTIMISEQLRAKLLNELDDVGSVDTGHNTGIDKEGKVVYDQNPQITGNTKALLFTGKNGEKYALLERCGNFVFPREPEDIPPGIIERIPEITPPGPTPKEYTIQGTKVWYDELNRYNTRPGSITIRLYRYDPTKSPKISLLETATVKGGKDNTWNFQFQGRYPLLTARGAHYYITEDYVKNYEPSNNNVVSFGGGIGQVSITNSLVPGGNYLQPKSNNLKDYGAVQGAPKAPTTEPTTPPADNKPQKGESSILDRQNAPAPNLVAPGAVDENKKEQGRPAHTNITKSPDGDVNKDVTDNVGDTTAPVTAPNDVPDPVNTTTPDSTGENSSVGSNPNDGSPVDFNGGD